MNAQKSGVYYREMKTGIYLDTLKNEVNLAYVADKPSFYFSNIYTPVCETGECKPVTISLYWDLLGNYLRFDQPAGEILTKVDHIPFTQSDYLLLDEILRGEDPRYGQVVSHSDGAATNEAKHDNQSSPAPSGVAASRVFMQKSAMVDAISGATMPEYTSKFVPGALYTTYTLWDLANTHRNMMVDYTRKKLFVNEYRDYFYSHPELQCQKPFTERIASFKKEENALMNTWVSIIDTTNSEALRIFCMDQLPYNQTQEDTVNACYLRLYFGDASDEIRRKILAKWSGAVLKSTTTKRLPATLEIYPTLFYEILAAIRWQEYWPGKMIPDLVKQIEIQNDPVKKKAIYDMIIDRRPESAKTDWELVKATKRKYGW